MAVNFIMEDGGGVERVAGTAEVVDGEALTPAHFVGGDDETRAGDYIIVKNFNFKRSWGKEKVHAARHVHMIDLIMTIVVLRWRSATRSWWVPALKRATGGKPSTHPTRRSP